MILKEKDYDEDFIHIEDVEVFKENEKSPNYIDITYIVFIT